jgi:hypothetical protein
MSRNGRRTLQRPGLSPIEREGIRALYNSAPFKLLRCKPPNFYSIPIVPIHYLSARQKIEWCSAAIKDKFDINIHTHSKVFSKQVVHPYALISSVFQPRGGRFTFQYRESFPRFPPAYAEYSYESLVNGYYCRQGWVLLSSSRTCPIQTNCRYYKPFDKESSSCLYYSGSSMSARSIAYSSMYTVYPVIRRLFFSREIGEAIFAIRLEDKPLAVARFLEDSEVRYYVDTIEFAPRNIIMYRRPLVFLREGIGMRLLGIRALELKFVAKYLRRLVQELLNQDITLARWITFKYELFKMNNGELQEKRGFKAFDDMTKIVSTISEKGPDSFRRTQLWHKIHDPDINNEDFISFAELVLLHSLSHMLKDALVTYIGCNPDDLQYFLEHPKNPSIRPRSEHIRLIIFEDAIGGLGYLKTLAQTVRADPQEYRRFARHLANALDSYRKHWSRMEDRKRVMATNLRQFLTNYSHIVNTIDKVYTEFQQLDVYPHVNAIREILSSEIISDADRVKLDDILSYVPLCWDGCQLCVIPERGCSFMVYDQPFLVSLRLSLKGFETIVNSLEEPRKLRHFIQGIKATFYDFLEAAENHIYIATPWISKNIVNDLFSKASTCKIRLLTSDDINNEAQRNSLNYMRQSISDYPQMEVRLLPLNKINVHAKGVMVDSIMLMEGSFNLTNSGLEEKIENLTVSFSPQDAFDFASGFERLWSEGKTLEAL